MDPAGTPLPFSWEDFGVTKEVFFEEPSFLHSLAVYWKSDIEFAHMVAFYRWIYPTSPDPPPVIHVPVPVAARSTPPAPQVPVLVAAGAQPPVLDTVDPADEFWGTRLAFGGPRSVLRNWRSAVSVLWRGRKPDWKCSYRLLWDR